MEEKYAFFQKALEKKREQKEYSQLRCVIPLDESHISPDRKILNFSSQDFLGLAQHPYVKKNTIKYVLEWGAGTTPSRFVTKHLECHRSVEEKLAELIGKETALLFPSAFQTHQSILSTLANRRSLIFIDRFCQHGLIQAAIASQAKVFRYEHQNLADLQNLLSKYKETPCDSKLIISESLFGFNGEIASLKELSELADKHQTLLYVDDSFAVEILGKHGMGLASHRKGVDIVMGSFGKSCGSFGAFIGCTSLIRDYLTSFNPQILETTALPPAVLGAISAALDLIPDMQVERRKVLSNSMYLQEELRKDGWEIGNPSAHITPLLCVNEIECLKLSQALTEAHILTTALLPPTVPQGACRLRLILGALHTQDQLHTLIQTLKNLKQEPSLSIV